MVLRGFALALTAGLMLVLGASQASADDDGSGSTILSSPGFPGVCDEPCYEIEKSFQIFNDGNPAGPGVCSAGENTFLYTLQHIGGNPTSFPGNPILPILAFEVEVEDAAINVASAGYIPGAGTVPSLTTINTVEDVVTWDFLAPALLPFATTVQLFICSPLPAGGTEDRVVGVSGPLSLDANGTCVGPVP